MRKNNKKRYAALTAAIMLLYTFPAGIVSAESEEDTQSVIQSFGLPTDEGQDQIQDDAPDTEGTDETTPAEDASADDADDTLTEDEMVLYGGTLDNDKLESTFYKTTWDTGIAAIGEFIPGGRTIGTFINGMFGGVLFPSGPTNSDVIDNITEMRREIGIRFNEVDQKIDTSTAEIKSKIQTTGVISAYGPRYDDMYTSFDKMHDNMLSIQDDSSLTDVQKTIKMGSLIGSEDTWQDGSKPMHMLETNQRVLYETTLADTNGRDLYTVVYDDCTVSAMFSGEALDFASPYIDRLMLQQVYSYSVAMEALSAQRTMMALTRDQLAEIETYSSIDKAYYTDLYNSSRTSIERIEAQMTKLSDNMFGEGESIWRHYIKFKNIYRLTYINKGNAKKILYPDMLCQRVDTLNASEVAGRIRDDVMNASTMSANDNLTVFNWAKSKNMTLREYLASVGFNMDDVPSSPSPVCLSLGGYEDSKSKMSFGPEGGLIHGYLWFIKYQGADVDQLDDARIRNLARYGKASKSSYESEARGWDRTYEGYVVNFKGDSDNSYADRNTIHAVSVRGDHIKSVSGSTWGFNGDSIRLEITPDTDHVVSSVTLTADDGSQIPYDQLTYSWESANFASLSDLPTLSNLGTLSNIATLSFTMPDSDVTVSVDFDRIALTADVEVENGYISLQEIETQNDRFIRDNKVQLTVGREMYVKCTAKIGYLFKSFSITDGDGNEYAVRDDTLPHSYFRFTVPDVDKLIIRAVFEEPECNLSIEGEAGDRINNQGSETPVQGDEIILKPYNILNARRGDRAINLTVMTIDGREVETEVLPDKSGIRFIMPAEKVIVTAEYADTKLWWYRVNNDPLTLYVRVDGKDVEVTRYDFGNVSKKTGKASVTAGYFEWQGIEYTVTYNGSTAQKITAATEHCVVIADPYVNVKQDEEVEFRVIPEEGYELYELTANDGHNREITKVSDDTYSVFFVADVVITARCREITPLFLDSYSLTLDSGNMGLNFYVDPKGQNENSISVVFSDGNMRVTKDKDGYLKYSCYIVPKNIDKVITASLIHNGKVAGTRSLSVADYCMKLLSSDADRVTKEMAQTTYDYGMAAKAYFFGTELDASVKARLDEVEIPESAYKYHAVGVGEVEGYNHLGFSFLLKSDITMREYFQLQGDPDEYSFIVDGKRVRPVKKGDYYYIDITRIQPHDIDNTHHYYVYKGSRPEAEDSGHTFELEYAPSTWLYNRVYESKTDEGLVYVCRSLYAYHLAAEKYMDIY